MSPDCSAFPQLLRERFEARLVAQRGSSAQTVANDRETFRLLLRFARDRLGRAPTDLTLQDLDAVSVVSVHVGQVLRAEAKRVWIPRHIAAVDT